MPGQIPKDPTWCSRCIRDGAPCHDHRGPDGKPAPYTGYDAYEPTSWVLEVVGQRYTAGNWAGDGPDVLMYHCFGYDRRVGFWMRQVDGDRRETNVSERAIGATFHEVRMTWGAWELLRLLVELERLPTAAEASAAGVGLDLARRTLTHFGYLSEAGQVSTEARTALAARGKA